MTPRITDEQLAELEHLARDFSPWANAPALRALLAELREARATIETQRKHIAFLRKVKDAGARAKQAPSEPVPGGERGE